MSALPILRWPDPRLSQPCAPVEDETALGGLVDDMFRTMYAAPGRGLAAPQVGVMQRLFVMDAGWKTGEKTPLACINPHLLHVSETQQPSSEGCLSVPGVTVELHRAERIVLGYTDPQGETCQLGLAGPAAIVAQHELDHLDGVMHFDRMDRAARDALLAEYEGGT